MLHFCEDSGGKTRRKRVGKLPRMQRGHRLEDLRSTILTVAWNDHLGRSRNYVKLLRYVVLCRRTAFCYLAKQMFQTPSTYAKV